VEDGTLTTLHLALSKEGEEGRWYGGCYVQDKMMESSLRLCHLIMACRAHIYVCGDAQSTARDVRGILLDILAEQEGLGSEEAKAILQHLTHLGRYHEDIY
jgi:sulfite reductase alpha subunit-like flavoprotein